MKRAILFNAFLLLTATAIAVADGALDVSTGFFGGTVPNATTFASPVVFTGDNASGTGTLRIRPSDEDTQIVLCEASNNSTPEMCSNIQHVNISTTQSFSSLMTNGYYDSASAVQRRNTASGVAGINTSAGTTAANTFTQMFVQGTGGASAGAVLLQASGLATSNLILGSAGTVTTDIRGPILNGGSATCNGNWAGAICFNEAQVVVNYASSAAAFAGWAAQNSDATGYEGFVAQNNAGTVTGFFVQYNASFADADLANKMAIYSLSKLITSARSDDVAAGTAVQEWRDNVAGTGVLLMDVEGAGRVRPLLYGSQSNCSDGAGAAACSAAPAGSVVVDDGATTVVVSTTAVTANSQILLTYDSSLGTKLGVTCNTNYVNQWVSARTAATSFTVTLSADPATANPACISYFIVN